MSKNYYDVETQEVASRRRICRVSLERPFIAPFDQLDWECPYRPPGDVVSPSA